MQIPHDYEERVYAGVLGKIIGVYLGRPFEGWSYERIMAELGEIAHYVHEPRSGSSALNGKVVAEQIGAQIFIDGWAMVAPGDPELAADLARRAASVSHDGEAIYGAQVLAAMEAQAFVESEIDTLIDTGVSVIPRTSIIYRMIGDIREWHAGERDWRRTRE